MAIISFALTTQEFMDGKKTVTRRNWKKSYLHQWQKWWDEGKLIHDAWDKCPRTGTGKKIGRFVLTCRPYFEKLEDMPKADLVAEGGMVDTKEEFYELTGLPPSKEVAVIRFEKYIDKPHLSN